VDVEPTQPILGLWGSTKHDRAETPILLFFASLPLFVRRGDKLFPYFSKLHVFDLNGEDRLAAMGLSEPRKNILPTSPLPRGMNQPKLGDERPLETAKGFVRIWQLAAEPVLEKLVEVLNFSEASLVY